MRWDTTFDELIISLDDIASQIVNIKPTKQAIVSLVGRFYDPMGLISPVVMFQNLSARIMCSSVKLGRSSH